MPVRIDEDETPSLVTGEDLAATDDADRAHARSAALGQLRNQVTDVVSARIAALFSLAQSAGDDNAKVHTDAAAIADAVKSAIDDGALSRMLASIDLGLFGEGLPGLRGDLRVVPLAEVLQLLDVQEQSGVLTVERSGARVDIYFRRGRVDQAIADGVPDEFLLGRFVTDAELMTRADFEGFLESRASSSHPRGSGQKLIGQQLARARPSRRARPQGRA